MKYIIIILCILSYASANSQTLDSIYLKQIELEKRIEKASIDLDDAGSNFTRTWLFPAIGSVVSLVIAIATRENEVITFNLGKLTPAIIGSIAGLVSYLNACSDLKNASKNLRGSKK